MNCELWMADVGETFAVKRLPSTNHCSKLIAQSSKLIAHSS